MAKEKRESTPSRYRRAKSDCSIESLQKNIEETFGLPEGSIKIVYPTGRKARTDSDVGALRRSWGRDE